MAADRIVTKVGIKSKSLVSLYSIRAGILQLISPNLIDQTNTATFLPKVEQDTGSSLSGVIAAMCTI